MDIPISVISGDALYAKPFEKWYFKIYSSKKKDENLQEYENKKGKDPVFKDKNGGLPGKKITFN